MAYCPSCRAPISKDAEDCDVCGTSFGADTWLPLDSLPQPRTHSVERWVLKLGLLFCALGWTGLVLVKDIDAGLDALTYGVPVIALLVAARILFFRSRA